MNKQKLEEGDIFYVIRNGKYIFAKLLVDIDNRILKKEPNHQCKFYSGCYLIEVYKGIYDSPELTSTEIILPSQFTLKKRFYAKNYKIDWRFYDHEPINFKKIDFPENIETGKDGFLNFKKFDISITSNILRKDFYEKHSLNSFSSLFAGAICGSYYQMVDEAFHFQGRDDLMSVERTHFLNKSDLRLEPKERAIFYAKMNENINISYYELALKYGFDLGRFYK